MIPKDLPPHLCTQAQLAKELGVAAQRVSQVIKEGKINEDAQQKFKGTTYLIRDVAIQQWRESWTGRGNPSAMLAHALQNGTDDVIGAEAAAKQKSLVAKARDLEVVTKSQHAKLKYDKDAGLVISREMVNKALFEFAREHRNELTALPARTIDRILAAKSRHEALLILQDEIQILLENFANIPNRLNQKIDGK